ncbi:MAG: vWA domain-containing protein [Candidatus Woesearchaeota archaeon]
MHTVLDIDDASIDKASVLADAINNNVTSFTPDFSFEQMVKDYKTAKNLYGETMIRELTGFDPSYVGKNMNIPEFRREIKKNISQNIEKLKKDGLLNDDGSISDEGFELSALSLIDLDFDKETGEGVQGRVFSKKRSVFGDRSDSRNYLRSDNYKDINFKKTVRRAIRRNKSSIDESDFVSDLRSDKGKLNVLYCIDSSGSMKGEKIKAAKKAGITLAFKALKNNDKAGLVVFNSKIEGVLPLTDDFVSILRNISRIRTTGETDIAVCIDQALKLFDSKKNNHLILITDGVHTHGTEEEVLEKIGIAANQGISLTLIGINIDKNGEKLAKDIINIIDGRFYKAQSLEGIDDIVLEDYYSFK